MSLQPYLIVSLLGLSLSASAAALAPKLLPFQGHLTDTTGKPVADGAKLIQFRIYDAPVAGQTVWAGEVHRTTVNAGLVNVLLGSRTRLDRVDFDRTLYLEITVDANGDNALTAEDPPLLPRQALLPVLFAKEAGDSRLLDGHDWSGLIDNANPTTGVLRPERIQDGSLTTAKIAPRSITGGLVAGGSIDLTHLAQQVAEALVPAGSVMAFYGTTAPAGWLLCNGSIVSATQYPALFGVIGTSSGSGTDSGTFRLPDLRGMFLRGLDSLPDLAFTASAVDAEANTIAVPNHGLNRTGYPIQVRNSIGTLPGGLANATTYFAIVVDANTIKLAANEANAFANTPVDLTNQGAGANVLVSWVDPDKGTRLPLGLGGNAGNLIGSFQNDEIKRHSHDLPSGVEQRWNQCCNGQPDVTPGASTSSPAGGNESRPKNVYVNYIIKY